MQDDEISYKNLRKIQELEKGSPLLTELGSSFYLKVNNFITDLEKRLESESSAHKQSLLKDEIKDIKKIASNIYEQREKKIILAAVTKVRGGKPDISKLMSIEKQLFDSVLKTIIDSRNRIWSKKIIEKKENETPDQDDGINNKGFESENSEPVINERSNNPILKIKENIPEFIGTDEKKYNLRTDDVISLPENMAEMLLKRNVAKKVEI
jgi:DNA replication initiation complex subunit (GINS family)